MWSLLMYQGRSLRMSTTRKLEPILNNQDEALGDRDDLCIHGYRTYRQGTLSCYSKVWVGSLLSVENGKSPVSPVRSAQTGWMWSSERRIVGCSIVGRCWHSRPRREAHRSTWWAHERDPPFSQEARCSLCTSSDIAAMIYTLNE